MIKKIIQYILLVVIIAIIGYVGLNIYACAKGPDIGNVSIPGGDTAKYSVRIVNTNNLLLTDKYVLVSGCG